MVEQAAIMGALNPKVLGDEAHAAEIAAQLATRMDALENELERGWQATVTDDSGIKLLRTLRGVTESHVINASIIHSSEARRLDNMSENLKDIYANHGTLAAKEKSSPISGPVDLVTRVIEMARKGLGIQRYKGLGEMNPEQLWETTLDPNVRILLQVKVAHSEDAGEVFSTLMGDVVEPRRDFIQQNALKVANLDA